MKKLIFIFFIIPNILFASSMKMIGEKGKLSDVSRTIEIKMYDNYFEPNEIKIKKDAWHADILCFLIISFGIVISIISI